MIDPLSEYEPPSDETIEHFAQNVSKHMAIHYNKPHFARHDVVAGFASALKILGRIRARRLSNKQK